MVVHKQIKYATVVHWAFYYGTREGSSNYRDAFCQRPTPHTSGCIQPSKIEQCDGVSDGSQYHVEQLSDVAIHLVQQAESQITMDPCLELHFDLEVEVES